MNIKVNRNKYRQMSHRIWERECGIKIINSKGSSTINTRTNLFNKKIQINKKKTHKIERKSDKIERNTHKIEREVYRINKG